MQINVIMGVVEPVTSTSGMTVRGTSTASYSTAAMPTIKISTAHNTISSVNTSMPGHIQLRHTRCNECHTRLVLHRKYSVTGRVRQIDSRWHIRSAIRRNNYHAEWRGSPRNQPGTRSIIIYTIHALGGSALGSVVRAQQEQEARDNKPEQPDIEIRCRFTNNCTLTVGTMGRGHPPKKEKSMITQAQG